VADHPGSKVNASQCNHLDKLIFHNSPAALGQLCQMDARIARAYRLIQAFLALVRERRGSDLEAWITAATDSGLDALARFARGLRDDLAAVIAGFILPWSNGLGDRGGSPCPGATAPETDAFSSSSSCTGGEM
jgi:hypothetical protein